MINEFYRELMCGLTGDDCSATAAWLQAALRQDRPQAAARAEAFYSQASEPLRHAVGELCGWCNPRPLSRRRRKPELLKPIAGDFNELLARAKHLVLTGEF